MLDLSVKILIPVPYLFSLTNETNYYVDSASKTQRIGAYTCVWTMGRSLEQFARMVGSKNIPGAEPSVLTTPPVRQTASSLTESDT